MRTKDLTRIALFAALAAVMSQIMIPLPFSPVPLCMATLAVMLCGGLLPPRQAWWSMVVFLLLGALGLPVFSGFAGGIGRLLGPTGGYLIAYPVAAAAVSVLLFHFGHSSKNRLIAAALCSLLCFLMGTVWLALSTGSGLKAAFLCGTLPFLPAEAFKIVLAVFLLKKLYTPLSR